MDTKPAFGFKQLFTHIVGDMAKAISVRNGESQEQKFARLQAATQMIMDFMPRDVIEAMLAGHCVMFHEVMTDSVRETLSGEMDTMRRATRANIVAMHRCFGDNLTRLERYQTRPSEGRRDAPAPTEVLPDAPKEAPMTVPTQAGAVRPVTRTDSQAAKPAPVPARAAPTAAAVIPLGERPEAIAACKANPEAMAALEAGDPARFARALGLEPNEEFLAAASSPGSPFDRGNRPADTEARAAPVSGGTGRPSTG